MRGVFSTGVLDGFLERQFDPFHLYVGVSAGATSIAAYLAEMHGRNRRIYTELSTGPEFINLARFLRGGHLMDLDWLWNVTISLNSGMRLAMGASSSGGALPESIKPGEIALTRTLRGPSSAASTLVSVWIAPFTRL